MGVGAIDNKILNSKPEKKTVHTTTEKKAYYIIFSMSSDML